MRLGSRRREGRVPSSPGWGRRGWGPNRRPRTAFSSVSVSGEAEGGGDGGGGVGGGESAHAASKAASLPAVTNAWGECGEY